MKRCPQCQFIYPDTDTICDFDQTPLVDAPESEIAAITNTPERPVISDLAATHTKKFEERRSRKTLPIAAAAGIALGVSIVGVYVAVQRQLSPTRSQVEARVAAPPLKTEATLPSPSPSVEPSPSPSPTPDLGEKSQAANTKATAHSSTSAGPVSTSPQPSKSTKSVILLTSGAKLEADEVWKTKDGVWYRRDGVVTLLKKNRVKAVVNR